MKNFKPGKANLAQKVAAVLGFSIFALTMGKSTPMAPSANENDGKSMDVSAAGKPRPMPILKLNVQNPADSRLIAQHSSHSSHASHGSHGSHSSHSSHSSGALFS